MDAFWEKVDIRAPSECWPWQGIISNAGYGRLNLDRKMHEAHRLAYLFAIGPIPEGYQIDHLCHTSDCSDTGRACSHRRCVNPHHLEAVPQRVNLLRGNGLPGLNIRKTHCPQGHPYSGGNLRVRKNGHRVCRECSNLRTRKWWSENKEAVNAARREERGG